MPNSNKKLIKGGYNDLSNIIPFNNVKNNINTFKNNEDNNLSSIVRIISYNVDYDWYNPIKHLMITIVLVPVFL